MQCVLTHAKFERCMQIFECHSTATRQIKTNIFLSCAQFVRQLHSFLLRPFCTKADTETPHADTYAGARIKNTQD